MNILSTYLSQGLPTSISHSVTSQHNNLQQSQSVLPLSQDLPTTVSNSVTSLSTFTYNNLKQCYCLKTGCSYQFISSMVIFLWCINRYNFTSVHTFTWVYVGMQIIYFNFINFTFMLLLFSLLYLCYRFYILFYFVMYFILFNV